MLTDVTVVVRSSYERTEPLCVDLLQQQVQKSSVFVIHERPFSQALRQSFQLGIDHGKDWTLCVDADVLVASNSIVQLVEKISNQPDTMLGGHGRVLDKMYGKSKYAGIHLYRTRYLAEAVRYVPDSSVTLRPETYVKNFMRDAGHNWSQLTDVIAVHDYEQYFSDIYRTMMVRARKSADTYAALLKRAESLASRDKDFLVCLWALRIAHSREEEILLDSEQWREEATLLLGAHGLREKPELSVGKNSDLPDHLLREHNRAQVIHKWRGQYRRLYRKLKPFAQGQTPEIQVDNG